MPLIIIIGLTLIIFGVVTGIKFLKNKFFPSKEEPLIPAEKPHDEEDEEMGNVVSSARGKKENKENDEGSTQDGGSGETDTEK